MRPVLLHCEDVDRRIGEDARRLETVRPAVDIDGLAELRHAALRERCGRAAEKQCLQRLRRRVDEDRAGGGEDARQLLAQLLAELVVEVGERLVEEHEIRLLGDGAGEGGALLLAAGKLERLAIEQRRQLQKRRGLSHAPVEVGLLRAGNAQRRGDVLVDGEVRVVDELLIDHGHRTLAHGNAGHILAVEEDAAFGRHVEPGHQPHDAGFAGERGSEQDVQRAVREGERHVVDVRLVAHALRHVAELERHRAAPAITTGSAAAASEFRIHSSRRAASLWLTRRPSLERRQSTSSAVRAHSCSAR